MKAIAKTLDLAFRAVLLPMRFVGWLEFKTTNNRLFFWMADHAWPEATKQDRERDRWWRIEMDAEAGIEAIEKAGSWVGPIQQRVESTHADIAVVLIHPEDAVAYLRAVVEYASEKHGEDA